MAPLRSGRRGRSQRTREPGAEALEPRRLLAAALTVVSVTNVSRREGNEAETAVSLFVPVAGGTGAVEAAVLSNLGNTSDPATTARGSTVRERDADRGRASGDAGLFRASYVGTALSAGPWEGGLIAAGTGGDGLEAACCDPSAARDSFGNLYVTYLNLDATAVVAAVSRDNGQTFTQIGRWRGDVDQPTIVTGPTARGDEAVYVMFSRGSSVVVTGAVIAADGNSVGRFAALRGVGTPGGGRSAQFGDIAIGPAGQVAVAYQVGDSDAEESRLYVSVDTDGPFGTGLPGSRNNGFGRPVQLAVLNLGTFSTFPAQPTRGVDSEVSLAWDRSGGMANGRLYAAYTDRTAPADTTGGGAGGSATASDGTRIVLRYSDDVGRTWSAETRLDIPIAGGQGDLDGVTKLLPRLAIDQSSGVLVAGWYDARFDTGVSGSDSTNDVPNDDVAYVATTIEPSADGVGVTVGPNVRVPPGVTNAAGAANDIDLGDYTGLDTTRGTVLAAWADNSNSAGDNPDGAATSLDVSAGTLTFTPPAPTSAELRGSFLPAQLTTTLSPGGSTRTVRGGRSVTLQVRLSDPSGLGVVGALAAGGGVGGGIGAISVVQGDSGAALPVQVLRVRYGADLRSAAVTIRVSPAGSGQGAAPRFSALDNGSYTVRVAGAVNRLGRSFSTELVAGTVVVAVPVPVVAVAAVVARGVFAAGPVAGFAGMSAEPSPTDATNGLFDAGERAGALATA